MKRVAFNTLGCKVNTYESEAMMQLFLNEGYVNVPFKDKADVYVINTCTVTNTGDSKSRQMIRKAVRQNEDAIVCVVGCYSQVASQDIAQIEGVDVILGTKHRTQIVDCVKEVIESNQQVIKVGDVMKESHFENLDINQLSQHTRAYLKIQDGCNNFCTYCIIPYARGKMRSREPQSVIDQANHLVSQGYVEIVLTGIHTAGYGQDLEDYNFYDLLQDLVKVEGLKRLRISSIEMSQLSPEIIQLISDSDIIVDHLHIPIQSGCDTVLKRMNRHYTTSEFASKLDDLRKRLPKVSITTDVITGFPGESDEEFESTYNWIKDMKFYQLHVFPYSKREGTPAARMKEQIHGDIKHQRVQSLIQLSERLQREYIEQFVGQDLDVLFEERNGDYVVGHASNYIKVEVPFDQTLIGQMKTVHIESVSNLNLQGSV